MQDEWQPIETAPKDGTDLLLWQPTNYSGYAVVGCFDGGAWHENMEGLSLAPTHWLPLPAPPQEAPDA